MKFKGQTSCLLDADHHVTGDGDGGEGDGAGFGLGGDALFGRVCTTAPKVAVSTTLARNNQTNLGTSCSGTVPLAMASIVASSSSITTRETPMMAAVITFAVIECLRVYLQEPTSNKHIEPQECGHRSNQAEAFLSEEIQTYTYPPPALWALEK